MECSLEDDLGWLEAVFSKHCTDIRIRRRGDSMVPPHPRPACRLRHPRPPSQDGLRRMPGVLVYNAGVYGAPLRRQ